MILNSLDCLIGKGHHTLLSLYLNIFFCMCVHYYWKYDCVNLKNRCVLCSIFYNGKKDLFEQTRHFQ